VINHHPPLELLVDYVTGSLNEGMALGIASHVALCALCRARVPSLQAIGGALLDDLPPAACDGRALASVMARLDDAIEIAEPSPATALDAETTATVPYPLHRYLAASLRDLQWHSVGRWFDEVRLPLHVKGIKASLMRIKSGALMPRHDHRGVEFTLVLAGGYRDEGHSFRRGDFDLKDVDHAHQPVVDEDGECICLAILDAPVKLTGSLGLLVNPFLRL
jgi:putative transcriptional regulator